MYVKNEAGRKSKCYVGTIDSKDDEDLKLVKRVIKTVNENLSKRSVNYRYEVKLHARARLNDIDTDRLLDHFRKSYENLIEVYDYDKRDRKRLLDIVRHKYKQEIPHVFAERFDVYIYRRYK